MKPVNFQNDFDFASLFLDRWVSFNLFFLSYIYHKCTSEFSRKWTIYCRLESREMEPLIKCSFCCFFFFGGGGGIYVNSYCSDLG